MKACLLAIVCGIGLLLPVTATSVTPAVAKEVLQVLERADEDLERALQELRRLADRVRLDDDVAFVITERAGLLIQHDQLELARDEMAEALDERPPEFAPGLRSLYASTLLVGEDYERALEQLMLWEAHTKSPHPGGLFLMGYAYVQLERFEEAVLVLERSVNSEGAVRDQWVELLAYAYSRADRPADAVRLLERLVAEHPERARWWNRLAGVYMLMDEVDKGTASFAVSSMLEDLSFTDAKRLARLFSHLQQPADGAEVLSAAMTKLDEGAAYDDYMLLGELWMLAREFDLAIAAFSSAQELAENGEPAMMMGQLYAQRELYEPARLALTASVAAYGEETPPQVHYLLAIVEINLGNLDAANAAVTQLIDHEDYRDRGENLAAFIRNTSIRNTSSR